MLAPQARSAPAQPAPAPKFRLGRATVLGIPYVWLVLFFLIPFVIVLKISFSESKIAQPPYKPLFVCMAPPSMAPAIVPAVEGATTAVPADATAAAIPAAGAPASEPATTDEGLIACLLDGRLKMDIHLKSYGYLLGDQLYWRAMVNSLQTALISTILCLLIGYPMAYGIARSQSTVRNALLMLIILPFWTSFLIRVYSWVGILKSNGIINNVLLWLGAIDAPLPMMNTNFAVYVGIVYSYLPFMILPLFANLEKMDMTLLEAATDLGCKPLKAFFVITVPLSMPGIVAGSMLVFIPAVGEYVIPELLGGPNSLMIGRVLYNEFSQNRDWPTASAIAIVVLILLVLPLAIFQHYQSKAVEAGK